MTSCFVYIALYVVFINAVLNLFNVVPGFVPVLKPTGRSRSREVGILILQPNLSRLKGARPRMHLQVLTCDINESRNHADNDTGGVVLSPSHRHLSTGSFGDSPTSAFQHVE